MATAKNEAVWMDYSGSPPIVVPESLLPFWNGFYEASDSRDGDEAADLELADGRRFWVNDACDFENPQTDYDRLCKHSIGSGNFLFPVGPGEILAISDYSDGQTGWWPAEAMILTVSQHLPDRKKLSDLKWTDEIYWRIPEGKVYLMNSCLHGSQLADDCVELGLKPGDYVVDSADYAVDVCVMIHRFTRLG